MTLVKLISRRGNVLEVHGLDAVDGSPVLDIKPYYPPYDEPQDTKRVPEYVFRLAY